MTAKVLLVDDDPNILAAYTRTLRKLFQIETAQGGEEGLERIRATGPFAVILSDQRMPGMDGIQFLSRVRQEAPDSVRIMLTGNADQQTAIEAVNQGNIFRFLTKPCTPEVLAQALEAGTHQYQLITAERELLEGTLKGSVDLLVELLYVTDPKGAARAQNLGPLCQKVAQVMEVPDPWAIAMAAMLSQIGALTVPPAVLARARAGDPLTVKEHEALTRIPEIGSNLLRHIPRMEVVAKIILFMHKNWNGSGFPPAQAREEEIPLGSRILRVVSDYLDLRESRPDTRSILEEMGQKHAFYDPRVLNGLTLALEIPDDVVPPDTEIPRPATMETLEEGQILAEGVETRDGILIYPAGTKVRQSHIERLTNFARLVGVREPFLVLG
jgi:response regulator RpfG family c-di-GMP phosphodiesterase